MIILGAALVTAAIVVSLTVSKMIFSTGSPSLIPVATLVVTVDATEATTVYPVAAITPP